MFGIEQLLVKGVLVFFDAETINAFFRDPRATATILGVLISVAGGLLGSYLLLRGMSLTSDAISHTVLLGIVVAFLIMTRWFGREGNLSSPWLIVGAAGAGVLTVVLTELLFRSGLVQQDAALGLVFPLLFAVAVIFVSRGVDDVHLDEDAVMVGEIGMAWADTQSHCFSNCEEVTITPEDETARFARQCTNCRSLGIDPRHPDAEFTEICVNCGTYSPSRAWREGLVDSPPVTVFWPKSITVMAILVVATLAFVLLFYKELKLSTFDPELAKALGFRPAALHYALMVLVSLVAVGAFSAVGSILVIAFFILPPAAAYLLTDRVSVMLGVSGLIGASGAYFGYDLARGSLFGLIDLPGNFSSSISASMVLMMFLLFLVVLLTSPKYGLVSALLRHYRQQRRFAEQVVLGHADHHSGRPEAAAELAVDGLEEHFRWNERRTRRILRRLWNRDLAEKRQGRIYLTEKGHRSLRAFRRR